MDEANPISRLLGLQMLPLARVRRLLGRGVYASDGDLERLREEAYELSRVLVTQLERQVVSFREAMTLVPEEFHLEIAERAAIFESDAGLPRDLAERAAVAAYIATLRA